MSIAAGTCLGPGWLVVLLSGLTVLWNDLSVMLVHTMVRLMSVAIVAIVVRKTHPELGFVDFFGWLIGFYLLALVTEVWLLYRQRDPRQSAVSVSDV
ncbi:MAG: hypothetical protein MK102_02085, partial [Fuerstiella sp.]|nr:hypothetical protein [Fuerstiella sp.]